MAETKRRVAELVAQGPEGQIFRQQFVEGQVTRLGRAPASGWAISWDRSISREHADMVWKGGKLTFTCLPTAANPVRLRGAPLREIVVSGSESFEIGQTSFYVDVTNITVAVAPPTMAAEAPPAFRMSQPTAQNSRSRKDAEAPKEVFETKDVDDVIEENFFKSADLSSVSFGDPERQLEVLSKLPQLITDAKSDVDLAYLLGGIILEAIPPATAVAVALFEEPDVQQMKRTSGDPKDTIPNPKLMRVQTRDNYEGRFVPSRRLLRKALVKGENVMHIVGDVGESIFTMANLLSWAFCVPITAESCLGWCLYVSGSGGRGNQNLVTADMLKGDLRFTQMVSQLMGSIRTVRTLQEQKTQLSSFFSPKVIENLTKKGGAGDILAPSEREITILFCDVRGFSRKAEELKDDLHRLLNSVKAALGAMTGAILEFDGSIADFQGDAAMGFWGWPNPLPDGPMSACRAAFSILRAFELPPEERGLLEGFSVGAGISHGRAIAGQIGTAQQAKIGVFGPIVNQGSRIEGLTRQFGVSICIDEATANFVRRLMPPEEGRCRRLARVRPKGMETQLLVHELLPPESEDAKVNDMAMLNYEAALDSVIAGRWDEAIERLDAVPDSDGPKKFLLAQMAKLNNTPPADWDGSFRLDSK
jgi:adenylate cyclase